MGLWIAAVVLINVPKLLIEGRTLIISQNMKENTLDSYSAAQNTLKY